MGVVGLQWVFPNNSALRLIDASLVMAQVALLLVWMTLDGKATIGRALGAACIVTLIQWVHTVPYGIVTPGIVCTVMSILMILTVLAIPLSIAQGRGLQLKRFTYHDMPPPRRLQFSIRSLMILTVSVALLFGLKGVTEGLSRSPDSIGRGFAAALAVAVMVVVVIAIYLSIPLVVVWIVLTPGRILPRLATAVVGWALGAVLVFHYTEISAGFLKSAVPAIATAGGILIVFATLLVLRAMGYRAVWPDRDVRVIADGIQPSSPFKAEDRAVDPDAQG